MFINEDCVICLAQPANICFMPCLLLSIFQNVFPLFCIKFLDSVNKFVDDIIVTVKHGLCEYDIEVASYMKAIIWSEIPRVDKW